MIASSYLRRGPSLHWTIDRKRTLHFTQERVGEDPDEPLFDLFACRYTPLKDPHRELTKGAKPRQKFLEDTLLVFQTKWNSAKSVAAAKK